MSLCNRRRSLATRPEVIGLARENPGVAAPFSGRRPERGCLTPARQLYSEVLPGFVLPEGCCDAYGCGVYNKANRDPYWPDFAHPRWLSCQKLHRGYY